MACNDRCVEYKVGRFNIDTGSLCNEGPRCEESWLANFYAAVPHGQVCPPVPNLENLHTIEEGGCCEQFRMVFLNPCIRSCTREDLCTRTGMVFGEGLFQGQLRGFLFRSAADEACYSATVTRGDLPNQIVPFFRACDVLREQGFGNVASAIERFHDALRSLMEGQFSPGELCDARNCADVAACCRPCGIEGDDRPRCQSSTSRYCDSPLGSVIVDRYVAGCAGVWDRHAACQCFHDGPLPFTAPTGQAIEHCYRDGGPTGFVLGDICRLGACCEGGCCRNTAAASCPGIFHEGVSCAVLPCEYGDLCRVADFGVEQNPDGDMLPVSQFPIVLFDGEECKHWSANFAIDPESGYLEGEVCNRFDQSDGEAIRAIPLRWIRRSDGYLNLEADYVRPTRCPE